MIKSQIIWRIYLKIVILFLILGLFNPLYLIRKDYVEAEQSYIIREMSGSYSRVEREINPRGKAWGFITFYGDFYGDHYKEPLQKIQEILGGLDYQVKESTNVTEKSKGKFFNFEKHLTIFWGERSTGYIQVNINTIRIWSAIPQSSLDMSMELCFLFLFICWGVWRGV